MNCASCQKKLDLYISGNLPGDVKKSVRTHLKECHQCHKTYATILMAEKIINQEKVLQSNPFLATRVMNQIELKDEGFYATPGYSIFRLLQPAALTASIVLALFIGIYAGNSLPTTTAQNRVPEELMLMDDASMESLNLILSVEEIRDNR
ncbi:zf-HC2 domain-containing protein [Plebeiibacterium marinum]|uniref:Zf-HC2 domain-containing protein n=1 Tax=Plebeiibacterium marinum TaxID=2992111 RepID=A0AAE3SI48_9BACT|nr:zf-HC2 domain-containing protein [Plebeiobacterium marinum]MCW3804024.1 zf-HC2 domain-containing protein [Plebeiobacterium marinum]